jgi:hypothetical protein
VFIHSGRAYYVPLSEIREKIPPLWQSLCSAHELRRACDAAAGGTRFGRHALKKE